MDEAGNIYDGEFNFIGQANNSDDEAWLNIPTTTTY